LSSFGRVLGHLKKFAKKNDPPQCSELHPLLSYSCDLDQTDSVWLKIHPKPAPNSVKTCFSIDVIK